MTEFEWISVVLTIFAVIIIPTLGLVLRLTIRWTRTEATLVGLAEDIRELVKDRDMQRAATDRRLRWLEENLWNSRGRRAP